MMHKLHVEQDKPINIVNGIVSTR